VLSVIQALILDCATGAARRRNVTVAYRAYHCTSVSTVEQGKVQLALHGSRTDQWQVLKRNGLSGTSVPTLNYLPITHATAAVLITARARLILARMSAPAALQT